MTSLESSEGGTGELNLIRHFRVHAPKHPWLAVGPGQDCAILNWAAERDLAFKIDQVIEGTHFLLKPNSSGDTVATPYQVGWKAMAKACSDIAACGFWPVAATVAVNLPKNTDAQLAMELHRGICACCERFSFALAGGDISCSDNGLSVVVSLIGEGLKNGAWLRTGAKPGDILIVTGSLGGSRMQKHLSFLPRLEEARQIRSIIPNGVHACIDITDGLSRDLRHMCDESGCGATIFEKSIPHSADSVKNASIDGKTLLQHALEDGEDFELLLAIEPSAAQQLRTRHMHNVQLTIIGTVEGADMGCGLVNQAGTREPLPDLGYEHRT